MTKPIKTGVIGVGYLGRFHAQKYAEIEDVELVGVADIDPVQADAVSSECNCTAFYDFHDLLDHVDAVSVAVPTSLHHEIALRCFEKNVDVLLEKPMTVTLEEADELIAVADERKLVFQVGHHQPDFLGLVHQLCDLGVARPGFAGPVNHFVNPVRYLDDVFTHPLFDRDIDGLHAIQA